MIHVFWLTVTWLLLTGELTVANVVLGVLLSVGILMLGARRGWFWRARRLRDIRPLKTLELIAIFLKEVVVSGTSVAIDVVRPKMRLRPAIIAFPTKEQTPTGVMILANLITMTPGTLSMYVDEEHDLLYVHTMQFEDAEAFRRTIVTSFARRVQEVTR